MKRIWLLGLCMLCVLLSACEKRDVPEEEKQYYSVTVEEETPIETVGLVPTVAPTEMPAPMPIETPIELTVYSQLSSFWGEQQGWFAKIMLDKFNVILNIQPDVFDTEEEWEQADIIVFGTAGEKYRQAAAEGRLLNWEENNLLAEHGSYIQEHMAKALEYNRSLTPELNKVFGFGNSVAASANSAEEYFYTWDIRWDLYKQLGYPEVSDLEDLLAVLQQMKALCPVDENGEETYALSLWPDWDDTMQFYVKSMAAAYYGYDELGMGLYDTVTGRFYGALEEDGPYLELLRFFNELYRNGLLDPASANRNYEDVNVKTQQGGTLFSIVNYAGSMTYNTEEHLAENTYMASLVPESATPLAYGLSITGGNRIWTISAKTEYPELCMDIINWLCTPEGVMVSQYGPQGLIWDYDAEGNTYFTEFGRECREDGSTMMIGEYAGTSYWDGFPQINNTTWSLNTENPDSNGERYNQYFWKSNIPEASCEAEQDWREFTGAVSVFDYFDSGAHVVVPATHYKEPEKSEELQNVWEKVSDCIVKGSWNAIYAESDAAFDAVITAVKSQAKAYGYETCVSWCEQEAAKRWQLEEACRTYPE